MEASTLAAELVALFSRDLTRWAQEIGAFTSAPAVWKTVPGISNPAGTLALHVEGNLREYVGRQLGGIASERDRPLEFSARDVEPAEIVRRLEAVRAMVAEVVGALGPAAMDAPHPEAHEGRRMATRAFLVHLYGHLNYHLGQADYTRRVVTGDGAIPLARSIRSSTL